MNLENWSRHLEAFIARDYDAVCTFLAPDVAMHTMDHTIRGHDGIQNSYGFFHEYFEEKIAGRARRR